MDLFTLVARLGMDSSEYERGISKARGSFNELGNSISAKAVAIGNMVSRAVEKAVNVAADLGKSAIQNAADVTAEKAQFKATFGVLQGEADAAFKNIEKSTGVFGTRLKNVGTKAFSQFKGAGLDGVEALGMMEEYTNLAADAAAYYDISLEDADARLRSFLRGNTEAGDAIGLFTSESQRNSAAMEKYGQKWQALTEAQKQMLMLDISKDIYQQSGAIGQAARESDAWTNVVGNLKEVWRQATALIGEPIVSAITPIIQDLTGFLQDEGVQTKFTQFGLTIANIANATFEGVKGFIDKLTQPGTGENQLMVGIETFAEAVLKIAGETFDGIIGFIRLLIGENDTSVMKDIGTFLTDVGTFVDDYSTPILVLINALLAFWAIKHPFKTLLAALEILIINWTEVKEWTADALTATKDFFEQKISDPISGILQTIGGWFESIITSANNAADAIARFFGIERSDYKPSQTTDEYFAPGVSGGEYDSGEWNNGYDLGPTGAGRSFATGLDYVPYDDYFARLHEGEAVLTKSEANNWRKGENVVTSGASAAEIASAVAQALDGAFVDMDSEHVGRLVLPTVSRGMAQNANNRRYSFG